MALDDADDFSPSDRFASIDDRLSEAGGASDAAIEHQAPETVGSAVRDAFEQAKEVAQADGDPEKLEQIRVRRAKDGKFERGERDATGQPVKEPKEPAKAAEKDPATPAQETVKEPQAPAANAPLALRPPPGWSAQARADYAKLPPHIQQAVAQREVEVNKGLAALAEYKGIEAHLPRIKASNLTPAQFVNNAVQWEDSLKANPEHTVMQAIKLGGIDPLRLSAKILQQAGYTIGPRQQGAQPPRQQPQPQVNVSQLVQREFQQREQAAAQQKATGEAEAFLSDPKNVHAEAVVDDMVALIKGGRAKDFATAYEMACFARPDIRELLIKQRLTQPSNGRTRQVVNQARSAARATVGAPSGLRPASASPIPAKTVRDAVRQAYMAAQDAD